MSARERGRDARQCGGARGGYTRTPAEYREAYDAVNAEAGARLNHGVAREVCHHRDDAGEGEDVCEERYPQRELRACLARLSGVAFDRFERPPEEEEEEEEAEEEEEDEEEGGRRE